VVLLLIGFDNSQNSWSDAETVSLLVIGVVMLVVGSINEIYTKKSPIIPPRLFQTRTTTGLLMLTFLHGEPFGSWTIWH
jgi:MFS-type transporter involved in bile tolerance (Atg22 family)